MKFGDFRRNFGQAAAAVTETKVVTQVVTTGAVVRSPEQSSPRCCVIADSDDFAEAGPLRRLMILRVTESQSGLILESGRGRSVKGRGRECW